MKPFKYIYIIPLLKEHYKSYFLFLFVLILIVYAEMGLILYMLYVIKMKKLNIIWPISILKYFLPIMCIGFFGHNFLFFLILFVCDKDKSYISSKLECRKGTLYRYFSALDIIAIIFHLLISILTNILYYRSIFDRTREDIIKKFDSTPDISLFFTKIIIIIIILLIKPEGGGIGISLALLLIMLVTGLNAYINIHIYARINITINILTIILSLILFIGFFILFVGSIAKSLGYDGNIFLFFILVIIISFFVVLYRNKDFDIILKDYRTIINPDEYISYILLYYRMIKNKDNSRNYSSMLKSYIETIEETCTIKDCPLEQYVQNLGKGDDSNYLLRKFLDKLFKYGNSKFKNYPKLKNAYSMLLLKMNHKKQAIIILNSIKFEKISFQTKYDVYRCKKLIEKFSAETNSYYFNYRTKVNNFKKLIAKTTSLYNEFWSLIYGTKFQHSDNFKKLFKIGSKIMELNQKIEETYYLLIQTKTNNIDIYKLYNEYVQNILKDEEKNENCGKIRDMIFSKSVENEEKIYSNFDMDFLKHNGDTRYLLISGNKKDLGTIIDCSSSAAYVFGYTKEEIIGKHVNIFIPEIFHQKHNIVMSKQSAQYNLKLFNDLYNKKEYNPSFIQDSFFGVFKSKFIKSLKLKIYFVKTEDNLLTFVVEILKDIPYMSNIIENRIIPNCNLDNRYCVLTNESFLIHSFTANCVEQLGLSYRYIKSNNSIIPCIKQFYEDYLNFINDDNYIFNSQCKDQDMISNDDSSRLWDRNTSQKNLSFREKQNIKKELINKKYNKKCQITWSINKILEPNEKTKTENNNSDYESKCSRISHRGSGYNFAQKKSPNEKNYERELLMEIKKIVIDNTLVGYYFFFSRIHTLNVKYLMSYSDTLREKNYENNEDSNKVIKYKVLIKPLHKLKEKGKGEKRVSNTIIHNKNASIFKSSSNFRNSKANSGDRKDKIESKKSFSNLGKGRNSVSFNETKTKKSMDGDQNDIPPDEVIIDEYFVPDSPVNFALDLNNMIYTLEKDDYKSVLLASNLQKEAIFKIKQYHEYLKTLKSKSNILDLSKSNSYESGEEDDNSSYVGEDSEYSDIEKNTSTINNISRNSSLYKRHSNIFKSITLKNRRNTHIETISPIGKCFTLNIIKEVKENSKDEIKERDRKIKFSTNTIIQQQTKRYQNVNTFNNYYKVDLSNIYFMIYDFNRDMIVEAKEEEKILEIERIKNESKKRNSIISIGKDQNYPHVSMKVKRKESQKKKENKVEEINKQLDNIKQSVVKEEKSFERKIKEAINNKNKEESIKKLKIYTMLLFIIILILGSLTLYICFRFHRNIQKILLIIKNIIKIKYCNTLSIYYIRELTLLNFNVTNIDGGIYHAFPGNDRNEYETLIKNNFGNLFFENQLCIMQILSSNYVPSTITQKNLSETIFNSKYIIENNTGTINVAVLSTLIQYNAAFYSLSSCSTPIEQNHPDLYNYIYNSFNNYRYVILLLNEKFNIELEIEKVYITYNFYIFSIAAFFIIVIGSFYVVKSFISGAMRRINYMQVFYDINVGSIKILIDNCEKLLNKLKKDESNIIDDYTEESIEEKKSLIKNKKNVDKKNEDLINEEEEKNKFVISRNNKIFIFFYLLFIFILYFFFPFFFYNIYNIINLALKYSSFFTRLNGFHSNILDSFNVYREYLFDNQSIVQNMNPLDLLAKSELMAYDTITDDVREINNFLQQNIQMNEEVINLLARDLCSYTLTDYFQSDDDCKVAFGKILDYDFIIFATNFIQKIRSLKNVVKYKHDTELIVGNLTRYRVDIWKTWNDVQMNGTDKKYTFTLNLFNNETIHSNMNLIFLNIFIPFIDTNRKIVLDNILILGFENRLLLIFSIFLLLLFLIFLCYLFPKINSLSDFIYKTKNMLSLIPMTILTSQNNIKSLLKLS